ncbi:MAG: SLC13 family permease [Prevotellaceae bacterium]|nr:SLC13 family permease [Prevotellaceae bacterium]
MNLTLIILAVTVFFFMRGKVRSDLVALCSLLALVLFGVITPVEALAGFSNSVVVMMIGLFVVGGAIFRTGLAKMISGKILQLAGNNQNVLFLLVMVVTASIGAFVSNTGTVAVMLPIIMSMTADANINPHRYLMPLAFAGSMGLFTLISTPPNLVIQDVITAHGYEPLSFFSFAPVGFICLLVGIVVLFFLSKQLVKGNTLTVKPDHSKSLMALAEEYNLKNQIYKIAVPINSAMANKTVGELNLHAKYSINIIKILRKEKGIGLRKNIKAEVAGPKSIIRENEILYCQGSKENIDRFVTDNHLQLQESESRGLHFQESGVIEAFILPSSKLIDKTISEIRFRDEFNVAVLGIQRNHVFITDDFLNLELQAGDAFLLHGTWDNLAKLDEHQDDLVLVGQPLKEAAKVTLDRKAPVAATIMLSMILVMAFNIIPAVIAVLLAAVAMVVTGCLRNIEEAYSTIAWENIVLIGAMLPMATAFEKTGIAHIISGELISQLGSIGPYALLAGVYFAASLFTMFISNTATAVLFAPIAMYTAVKMNISPYPFMFAVTVGASMCFASPFSTPPNALVMSAGRYTFMDFVKVGLPLQIIMGIVMVLLLPVIFPFGA